MPIGSMPFINVQTTSGKIRYHYYISTPSLDNAQEIDPALPVILWFHSYAFPHVFHSQFADPLLRKFNLVAFDLRSHGYTEGDDLPEGYGIKEAAEDSLAFMSAMRIPPCHFVAMDCGSRIAVEIAVAHPEYVLSMFIISPTCLEEPLNVREGWEEVYNCWRASFPGPEEVLHESMEEAAYGFAQYMFSNNLTNLALAMSDASVKITPKHWGYYGAKNHRIVTFGVLSGQKAPTKEELSSLRCPVQLVHGTNNVAYSQQYTEAFLQLLKDAGVEASLLIVPGAPHFVCVDYANKIDPVLHDFILQNDNRNPPPVLNLVLSPWDAMLREANWDPESADGSDDDFEITYP